MTLRRRVIGAAADSATASSVALVCNACLELGRLATKPPRSAPPPALTRCNILLRLP